jgi:uncharacterized lipoprotein YmbA
MNRHIISHLLVAVLVGGLLAGCIRPLGGSGGPQPNFYIMTAEPAPPTPGVNNAARRGPIVGIAPVKLAEHLLHEQIVTRASGNRVVLADLHRWAAPLDNQFSSLLALNLSAMIPTDRVTVLPAGPAVSLDYRVEVEAAVFEQVAAGDVELVAVWQLFRGDEDKLLAMRKATLRQSVTGGGYGAIVNAMGRTLTELSRRIAAEIRGDL